MPNTSRYRMSQERLDELKEELYYLETVREKEVAEQIKDLIENAEIVDNIEVDAPKDTVTLGSIVRVRDLEDGFEETYEIVGSQEANPKQHRISDDSPVGRGLRGHRSGEVVAIQAPAGELKIEILSLENH